MPKHSDQSYCADAVRTFDRDRWLGAGLAPPDARRRLLALFALNVEIARISELTTEPLARGIRHQWWRDALGTLEGEGAQGHPVLREVAAAIQASGLGLDEVIAFAEARIGEADADAPPDIDRFQSLCLETGGALCRMAARLLGVQAQTALDAAADVGTAHAMVGQLRNTAWWAARDRIVLPLDLLDRHRVTTGAIRAGRADEGLALVAEEIAGRAAALLANARMERDSVPREALPALVIARLADGQLRRLGRRRFELLAHGIEPLPLTAPLAVLRGGLTGRY
ncbi:MAG: squalene/phytoene synthase family protein [Alphaproteobacteria bacterium]|nr:squalene/phytoene synthase family protein [Alphaproteobacteria bacterium]